MRTLHRLAAAGLVVLATTVPAVALATGEVTVAIRDALEPREVTVAVGTLVTWTNHDEERHRVRSRDGATEFDSGNLEPGESFTIVLEAAGDHPYIDERDPEDPAYHGLVRVTDGGSSQEEGSGGGDAPSGTGSPPTPGGDAPSTGDVAILDRSFAPRSITVATGATVTWSNRSDDDHTVTFGSGGGSGTLGGGATFRRTFDAPGTFDYLCAIHPEMTGTVTVTGAGGEAGSAPPPQDAPGGATDQPPPPQVGEETSPSSTSTRSAPTSGTVRIVDLAFEPARIVVAPGATVTWNNAGAAPHTVTGSGFDSGTLPSGGRYSRGFQTAGSFDYRCTLHPQMTATVVVRAADGASTGPSGDPAGAVGGSADGVAAGEGSASPSPAPTDGAGGSSPQAVEGGPIASANGTGLLGLLASFVAGAAVGVVGTLFKR